jgi:hypothetical protein
MSTVKENMDASQAILRTVKELQNGTGFGSIEITLHERRITQIEKREKLRFIKDHANHQKQDTSTTLQSINIVATNN